MPDVEVVGRAPILDDLLPLVDELAPQAVIISVRCQVVSTTATVSAARRLKDEHPETGIVVISDRVDGFALELLRGGAAGIAFLLDEQLPGIETVLESLRVLQTGQTVLDPSIVDSFIRRGDGGGIEGLTPRENDVLAKMAHGLSNRAIADELHLSVKSIEKGVTAIFFKLGPFDPAGADRRVSAALVFLRAQTDPFGPIAGDGVRTFPVVVLSEVEPLVPTVRT